MPRQFKWQGYNQKGALIRGTVFAENLAQAEHQLIQQRIPYQKIRQTLFLTALHLPVALTADFFYQLNIFLVSGISLLKTLRILQSIFKNSSLQCIMQTTLVEVNDGLTLSAIFKKYHFFDLLTQQLIAIGEETGKLNDVLNYIAQRFEQKANARKKWISLILYPLVLLCSSMGLIAFMLISIIPKFEDVFTAHHTPLPLPTSALIHLSHCLPIILTSLTIMMVLLTLIIKILLETQPVFTYFCHQYIFKLPLIGHLIRMQFFLRVGQILLLTLSSGMSLENGLLLLKEMSQNRFIQQKIQLILAHVREGQCLSYALQETQFFSTYVVSMIEMGEQSGEFERVFAKISNFYAYHLEHFMRRLSALLEPLIIIILGVLIGGIVIALYLPIFQLGTIF